MRDVKVGELNLVFKDIGHAENAVGEDITSFMALIGLLQYFARLAVKQYVKWYEVNPDDIILAMKMDLATLSIRNSSLSQGLVTELRNVAERVLDEVKPSQWHVIFAAVIDIIDEIIDGFDIKTKIQYGRQLLANLRILRTIVYESCRTLEHFEQIRDCILNKMGEDRE